MGVSVCEGLGKFQVIKECQNGHIAEHFSQRFHFCIPCTKQKSTEYFNNRKEKLAANPERLLKYRKSRTDKYAADYETRLKTAESCKEYRIKNEKKLKLNRQEKIAKNPEKYRAINKRSYAKNREKGKAYFRMRLYGVTDDQFKNMLAQQNNACAICFERKELVVDHNHTTGNVRGLLCKNCNLGIGHFSESQEALTSAINYLRAKNVN